MSKMCDKKEAVKVRISQSPKRRLQIVSFVQLIVQNPKTLHTKAANHHLKEALIFQANM